MISTKSYLNELLAGWVKYLSLLSASIVLCFLLIILYKNISIMFLTQNRMEIPFFWHTVISANKSVVSVKVIF